MHDECRLMTGLEATEGYASVEVTLLSNSGPEHIEASHNVLVNSWTSEANLHSPFTETEWFRSLPSSEGPDALTRAAYQYGEVLAHLPTPATPFSAGDNLQMVKPGSLKQKFQVWWPSYKSNGCEIKWNILVEDVQLDSAGHPNDSAGAAAMRRLIEELWSTSRRTTGASPTTIQAADFGNKFVALVESRDGFVNMEDATEFFTAESCVHVVLVRNRVSFRKRSLLL
eukprot:GHVU01096784.1.p2 GENE.GHVU01096784.1~~GHVU01096784.1.p2  ORF type:complete len:227 (-),score=22.62 GHVU01096784.1:1853-2533(-)